MLYIKRKRWNPFIWQDSVASRKKSNTTRARKKAMTFWKRRWDSQLISVRPTYDQIRIDVSLSWGRVIYLIAKPARHKYLSKRSASIFLLVNMRLRPREKSHRENALSGFIFPHPPPPPCYRRRFFAPVS